MIVKFVFEKQCKDSNACIILVILMMVYRSILKVGITYQMQFSLIWFNDSFSFHILLDMTYFIFTL